MATRLSFLVLFFFSIFTACNANLKSNKNTKSNSNKLAMQTDTSKLDTAYLAGGCFWCLDAVYRRMKGVENVISGYSNGSTIKPSYEQVCTGRTGHAEVVSILYDTTQTSYAEILEVFWRVHNPTTLHRQGNDVGTQYRSGIYYTNETQKDIALKSMSAAAEAKLWENAIVTEILPLSNYSAAEDYFANNPNNSYCVYVVGEKVEKFKKLFKEKLKAE
jgi:peptide-methionine (S)-S-oxide reductase